jgi:hypothetical protein
LKVRVGISLSILEAQEEVQVVEFQARSTISIEQVAL